MFNIIYLKQLKLSYTANIGTARQARDKNKIKLMRITCRITKATDTHSEQLIFNNFLHNYIYSNGP